MPRMIFVNLPVKDLTASIRFYEGIGCRKNEQFSDENSASMVWSDAITFQLLTTEYFKTFVTKPLANPKEEVGMLIALSRESREEVDAIVAAAASVGGKADIREAQDMGFMYLRSFEDPDGHVFEAAWMDMSAAEAGE